MRKPAIRRKSVKRRGKRGRRKKSPRVAWPSSKVCNLLTYSPVFREQSWQAYRIKDTNKGPEVWEVKWAVFWRKDEAGFPTRRHCLIVARNVLTGEVKYFLSNRLPGERNPVTGEYITLRWLLRVAFGRCSIESCFREGKEEIGLDHYELALCPPPLLRDPAQSFILRSHTTAVRRISQRQSGSNQRRTNPQRDERLAGRNRPASFDSPPAFRGRARKTRILPATQQAGPKVTHKNQNRSLHCHGHRCRHDQILHLQDG